MTSMPWFRTYSELLADKKIKHISEKLHEPKALAIGIWVVMLAIANDYEERDGRLMVNENIPITVNDLVEESGVDENTMNEHLNEFKTWEMISWDECITILNWHKRQFKSDNSTARVERFRNKPKETEPVEEPKTKAKKPKKPKEYPILDDGLPEWVPEPLRAICRAFQEESGVNTPLTFDTDWNKTLLEFIELKVTPRIITEAIERLRKNKMTVARPGGLKRTVISILAEAKSREIKYDADGNEVQL